MTVHFHFEYDDTHLQHQNEHRLHLHSRKISVKKAGRQSAPSTRQYVSSSSSADSIAENTASEVSFSVRVSPLPDESLSSFMYRAVIANGLGGDGWRQIWRYKKPTGNWESNISLGDLQLVASKTQIPLDDLKKMTFHLDSSSISGEGHIRKHFDQHILPNRNNQKKPAAHTAGLQYCPECLQSDDVPYIRKQWRYAYVVACPIHYCLLSNSCPHCSASFAPFKHRQNDTDMFECPSCETVIFKNAAKRSSIEVVKQVLPIQNQILQSISNEWTHIHGREVHCVPFLRGIRQLMTFASSGHFLLKGPTAYTFPGKDALQKDCVARIKARNCTQTSTIAKVDQIELFKTEIRANLLALVSQWLSDWPTKFTNVLASSTACRYRWWYEIDRQGAPTPYWIARSLSRSDLPSLTNRGHAPRRYAVEQLKKLGFFDVTPPQIQRYLFLGLMPRKNRNLVELIVSNKDARRELQIKAFRRRNAPTTLEVLKKQLANPEFHQRNEALKRKLEGELRSELDQRVRSIFNGSPAQHNARAKQSTPQRIDHVAEHLDLDRAVMIFSCNLLKATEDKLKSSLPL